MVVLLPVSLPCEASFADPSATPLQIVESQNVEYTTETREELLYNKEKLLGALERSLLRIGPALIGLRSL